MEDSQPAEAKDSEEIITYDAGDGNTFSKTDKKRQQVDNAMITELGTDEIVLRMACLFKFEMEIQQETGTPRVVKQIGVGIVHKCHGDISDEHFQLDIQWCPPRVKKGSDIYQNISADMKFDKKYAVSKYLIDEKKWTSPQLTMFRNASKNCLLVWNLDLTKDGKFKKPTSYHAARSQIEKYYENLK